jgi:hypothetical protein
VIMPSGLEQGLPTLCLQAPNTLRSVKVRKVKLSLCLTDQALRHEDVWGNGRIEPRILDLVTSWR